MMSVKRREFVKDSLAALGFLALPGGLFAAPAGNPLAQPDRLWYTVPIQR